MNIRIFKDNLTDLSNVIIFKHEKDFHYLVNVLKVGQGQEVYLFSSKLEVKFQVKEIHKNFLTLESIEEVKVLENFEEINRFSFILPIIKNDKLNLIAKQIVEMEFGIVLVGYCIISASASFGAWSFD